MEAVVKGLLESSIAGKSELDRRTPMQAAVIQLKWTKTYLFLQS
jgi:hypothetical protein